MVYFLGTGKAATKELSPVLNVKIKKNFDEFLDTLRLLLMVKKFVITP